ncbi:hypothetical protein Adeg_0722 [Ammonifex degensii KC4]|uniref:Uncharacterized protein n=1 Tax=Ammonifex degensii (strain DSM 10501 / KC4) TaxID=429009 RepID=C9RC92_AMMDK|nr:hypothetical protein [Ammonifex degensii]ACX51869.1 hypothetical protein Adeg_0722 [Ammonifex degensii KC4]
MRVYGIFDGVARDDVVAAAAVPDFATWKEITGRSCPQEYLDFLLEQEEALEAAGGGLLKVRVPLVLGEYRSWLSAGSFWQDGPEARGAWALEVARDPVKLRRLLEEHPVVPRAPEDRESVDVYFGVVLFPATSLDEALKLAPRLEEQVAGAIAEALRGEFPAFPPYRKISRLRAEGFRVVVGDRLVLTDVAPEVGSFMRDGVPGLESPVLSLPRRLRIRESELEDVEFPALVAVLLPVALHGAGDVLDACADVVEEKRGNLQEFSRAVVDTVNRLAGRESVSGAAPLVPDFLLPGFLEELAEGLELVDGEEDDGGNGGRGRKLRRIK